MNKPASYIAYFRVSTQRQGRSGLGLEAQQATVCAFLEVYGGQLLDTYTEQESGKRNARPELAAALEHCRKAKATLLLATLDRLARKVHFISGLMESKTPFVLADMPQATPFEIHIRAAMAEEEGRKISQRTRAALQAAKARGVSLGHPPELEALNGQRRATAEAYARELAPLIEQLRAEGITTRRGIMAALNRREIPTASGAGRWHPATVQALMQRIEGIGAG